MRLQKVLGLGLRVQGSRELLWSCVGPSECAERMEGWVGFNWVSVESAAAQYVRGGFQKPQCRELSSDWQAMKEEGIVDIPV